MGGVGLCGRASQTQEPVQECPEAWAKVCRKILFLPKCCGSAQTPLQTPLDA